MEKIEKYREKIRQIDSEIMLSVAERLKIAAEIGGFKRDRGLPVRDYAVESEVIARAREICVTNNINPQIADDLFSYIINQMVVIQDNVMITKRATSPKKVLVIGGAGKMGGWFSDFFYSYGFDVSISDIVLPTKNYQYIVDPISESKSADIIILATPLRESAAILEKLIEVETNALIFDILSLKSPIKDLVIRGAKKGLKISSIHPMFGPNVNCLVGKNILLMDCKNRDALNEIKEIFGKTSANLIEIDFTEHDRYMAYILGLSHFINIHFFNSISKSGMAFDKIYKIGSTTFLKQVEVSKEVSTENRELYFDIQVLNEYRDDLLTSLQKSQDEIINAIKDENPEIFSQIMEKGSEYFKGDGCVSI